MVVFSALYPYLTRPYSTTKIFFRHHTRSPLSCDIVCTILRPEIFNVRLVLNEKEAHDSDGSNNESDGSECDSE